jgi:hypothetical protein
MNSQQIINLVVGIFFFLVICVVLVFVFSKTIRVAFNGPEDFFTNLKNMSQVKNSQTNAVDVEGAYQKGRVSHDYDDYDGGHNKRKRKKPKRRRH